MTYLAMLRFLGVICAVFVGAPILLVYLAEERVVAWCVEHALIASATDPNTNAVLLALIAVPAILCLLLISAGAAFGKICARLAHLVVPRLDARIEQAQRTVETYARDLLESTGPTEFYDPQTWNGHLRFSWSEGLRVKMHQKDTPLLLSRRLGVSVDPLPQVWASAAFCDLSRVQRHFAKQRLVRSPWVSTRPRYSAHEHLGRHARQRAAERGCNPTSVGLLLGFA